MIYFFPRLRFSLSLTLPYPVRNSLPFTSFRSVTVGSGRDFLEGETYKGQSRGLLECADTEPVVAVGAAHVGVTSEQGQDVRAAAVQWVST